MCNVVWLQKTKELQEVDTQWPCKETCRKKCPYTQREREEWKQPYFALLSSLDIVAEGSWFVSDSWPHERLQRNARMDHHQSDWKNRKGLICTSTFFKNPLFEETGQLGTQGICYFTRKCDVIYQLRSFFSWWITSWPSWLREY